MRANGLKLKELTKKKGHERAGFVLYKERVERRDKNGRKVSRWRKLKGKKKIRF